MSKIRNRKRVDFWLDISKPDQHQLLELVSELKSNKSFAAVVRDGIRLVVDLWRGDLAVLLELFPWVEEAFYQRFVEHSPPENLAIQEQLHHLERLLIEQGSKPVGLRPALAPVTDPGDDPAPVALKITPAAGGGQASKNFLDSAFGLLG